MKLHENWRDITNLYTLQLRVSEFYSLLTWGKKGMVSGKVHRDSNISPDVRH